MRAREIFKILSDNVAPVSMSDEFCRKYGMYDNSGIILDPGSDITRVLFSLDLSAGAVEKARSLGADCIVTHHPAIFGGVKHMVAGDPQADNLSACIKSGMAVISMHLNFDCAPEGTDYHLMKALGGEDARLMDTVTGGGYGRVYPIKEISFAAFTDRTRKMLRTSRLMAYGDGTARIGTCASFCGAGGDEEAVNFAAENGADVFVSADMKHHIISSLVQRGMCVLNLTHYSSESYGFGKICEKMAKLINIPVSFYEDEDML